MTPIESILHAVPSRRRRAAIAGALAAVATLVACGSKPPPPPPPKPPAVLRIQLEAGARLNPDTRARPSPVVVRVYELKAAAAFGSADFLSLQERDQATLGGDLVAREELVLRPGESRVISRPLASDTRFVGVVAAFRDLERARWRALVELAAGRDNTVGVVLDDATLQASGSAR
jgi:type VI secretion system protein VasD